MKTTTLSLLFILLTFGVWAQPNAGSDTTHTYCKNEYFNLFDGLAPSTDMNGTWYDPSFTAVTDADSVIGSIPGQYNYYYVVTETGFPNDTSVHVIVIENCTGWEPIGVEEVGQLEINVFPNPGSGWVKLKSEYPITRLSLYGVDGQLVENIPLELLGDTHYCIDLTNINEGMYFMVFTMNSKVIRKKIELK